MNPLRVPNKFKRCGIKIKCLKCKWQLTDRCPLKNSNLNSCEFKHQHRYNLIVCVPNTKSSRKTKIIETKDFNLAMIELGKFKESLKENGYQKTPPTDKKKSSFLLVSLAADYLDNISGVNTPEHLIRIRSKLHIGECKKVIQRFCIALEKNGYNIKNIELGTITDHEVAFFHSYIKHELKLSQSSYNKHFVIMKAFVNWVIKIKMLNVHNYFAHAELTFERKEKTIITKEEFNTLLEVATYENGWGLHAGERRNYYKSWITNAFRLALETGTRAEELVTLKWNNIIEIEDGVKVIKINNLKVNRIQTGTDKGKNIRYIPITKGLTSLLDQMGYFIQEGSDDFILEREDNLTTKYLMTFISRSFGHFIKLATERKIEFKDLRKTYITRISQILGENTKIFTGHADNEVLKNHYISSAYLVGNLKDFDVFK